MSLTYDRTVRKGSRSVIFKDGKLARRIVTAMLALTMVLTGIPQNDIEVYATSGDVQSWYECLDKLADKMAKEHFWYSNSDNSRSYAGAMKRKRVSNCARYVTWALQNYGIISKDKVFWMKKGGAIGGDSGSIKNNSRLKVLHPNKAAAKCGLKPGDICGWKGMQHTAVYAGKNKKGQLLWYSAGRDGGTTSHGRTYFVSRKVKAKCRADRYNGTISTVIRIRKFKESVSNKKTVKKTITNQSKRSVEKITGMTEGNSSDNAVVNSVNEDALIKSMKKAVSDIQKSRNQENVIIDITFD